MWILREIGSVFCASRLTFFYRRETRRFLQRAAEAQRTHSLNPFINLINQSTNEQVNY